LYRNSAKLIM